MQLELRAMLVPAVAMPLTSLGLMLDLDLGPSLARRLRISRMASAWCSTGYVRPKPLKRLHTPMCALSASSSVPPLFPASSVTASAHSPQTQRPENRRRTPRMYSGVHSCDMRSTRTWRPPPRRRGAAAHPRPPSSPSPWHRAGGGGARRRRRTRCAGGRRTRSGAASSRRCRLQRWRWLQRCRCCSPSPGTAPPWPWRLRTPLCWEPYGSKSLTAISLLLGEDGLRWIAAKCCFV
ncbi:hypothetical protein SETIT_4G181100v2 [Setaria italica]|uniref:Uncharacterized protein n=1 Tax=Setaria italica TaxID=4555 RepID=A0A368QVG5_SETIT|nr:hypothetical protein SETIT_4G181100v2 [Setaria italica]